MLLKGAIRFWKNVSPFFVITTCSSVMNQYGLLTAISGTLQYPLKIASQVLCINSTVPLLQLNCFEFLLYFCDVSEILIPILSQIIVQFH